MRCSAAGRSVCAEIKKGHGAAAHTSQPRGRAHPSCFRASVGKKDPVRCCSACVVVQRSATWDSTQRLKVPVDRGTCFAWEKRRVDERGAAHAALPEPGENMRMGMSDAQRCGMRTAAVVRPAYVYLPVGGERCEWGRNLGQLEQHKLQAADSRTAAQRPVAARAAEVATVVLQCGWASPERAGGSGQA